MNVSKENIKKRLQNWKTWIALASLLGFICAKVGLLETKSFIDEVLPYIFTLGVSLGIWSDHEGSVQTERIANRWCFFCIGKRNQRTSSAYNDREMR